MKTKQLLSLSLLFLLLSAFRAEKPVTTIFLIGDSTMANKVITGGNPERGWGMMLGAFFTNEIRIDNHAQNGRSSKSFLDEGLWERVITQVKPGDYVFIQFGHNDQKSDEKRHTEPGSTFDRNLRRFVAETRAKGGIPVLFNSIVRRNFVDSLLVDTHGAYLHSPRNIAQEQDVPFIDLNGLTHQLVQQLGPEESKTLFMWVAPHTVPAMPDGREDNTHLNIIGARRVARLAVDALVVALPELGKYVQRFDLVVAADGSGDFLTIQEAINAVPDFRKKSRTTILVRRGTYKEKVVIPASKIQVSLIGEEGAVLTYDDYASKKNCFGEEKSTSGSSTCYIYAPDFYAENLTFENSSGPVGQAVACFVDGDRACFKNCRFLGFQDTLYTYGKQSRQYYLGCYIEGTVDFIFGSSTAIFDHCRIHSKGNGYVTAPSTPQGAAHGYLFYDCELTADSDVERVYLSRPWRPYAQATFIRCRMDRHILPVGWDNWGKPSNEKSVRYAEYQSSGAGASPQTRAPFSTQLKTLKGHEMKRLLLGDDSWDPQELTGSNR